LSRIIISVTNDITTDQRVLRTCDCFNELGFEILLIGRELKNSFEINLPYKTYRFHLFFNKGFLFYAEYNLRLFIKLLFSKKDLLYANDLDTLLPNFMISKMTSSKLIYDSHEYFTEVPELIARPKIKSFWIKLERSIFPQLKNVITVNQKLADIYSSTYKVPVSVIKNVPKCADKKVFDPIVTLSKDQKMILYQGSLNTGRGLELMIDAMKYLKNHLLVLAGDGDILDQLQLRVIEHQLKDRVIFLGKLLPEQLVNVTRQADIGLSLEEDLGLNYRYCLPNKVFDYVCAGIPVLVSDLPLLRELLSAYKIGECLTERNPENLAAMIEHIIRNKSDFQGELISASGQLNWENEKKVLIEFINQID
jgi:glycosyltransferase involved in cell wall biosynthesis